MKISHTIVLALAVIAALVYLFAVDREKPSTEQQQQLSQKLVDFRVENIGAIEITSAGAEDVRLVHRDGYWQTRRPATDTADPEAVAGLIEHLDNLEVIRPVDLSEVDNPTEKLEDLGLDAPRQEVLLKGDGEPIRIVFGDEDASGNLVFAQVFPSERIAQISTDIKKSLFQEPDNFRDPLVTRVPPERVEQILIDTAQGQVQLVLEDGYWQFTKPLGARADNQKVYEMLKELLQQPIQEYVVDNREELIEYGLVNPRATIQLWTNPAAAPEAFYRLEIGNDVDDEAGMVFASEPARDAVFHMSNEVLAPVNMPLSELRDRSLVDYPVDVIDQITIASGDDSAPQSVKLTRNRVGWFVMLPDGEQAPADQAALAMLFRDLAEMKIGEFVADVATDKERYGLETPRVKLTLHNNRDTLKSLHEQAAEQGQPGSLPPVELLPPQLELHIGNQTEGGLYLLNVNRGNIVIVPDVAFGYLDPAPYRWRTLRLHGYDANRLESLGYEPGDADVSPLQLKRDDRRRWIVTGAESEDEAQPDERLLELADSAARSLAALRGMDWAANDVRPEHGFGEPTLVVNYRIADREEPWRLIIGKEREEGGAFYARIDGVSGVFLLSRPDYEVISAPLSVTH